MTTTEFTKGDMVKAQVKRAGPNHRTEIVSIIATVVKVTPQRVYMTTENGWDFFAETIYVAHINPS